MESKNGNLIYENAFFIVSNIAILVPMSHPLPWNGPIVKSIFKIIIHVLKLLGHSMVTGVTLVLQ